jgi:hypothetical protein
VLTWEELEAFRAFGVGNNQTIDSIMNVGKFKVAIKGAQHFQTKENHNDILAKGSLGWYP